MVSSTSWTADEDFSILLDALCEYERAARVPESQLPHVLAVITGKGPEKEMYMSRVERLQRGEEPGREDGGPWKYVRCVSLWLESEDYPLLLGKSD